LERQVGINSFEFVKGWLSSERINTEKKSTAGEGRSLKNGNGKKKKSQASEGSRQSDQETEVLFHWQKEVDTLPGKTDLEKKENATRHEESLKAGEKAYGEGLLHMRSP